MRSRSLRAWLLVAAGWTAAGSEGLAADMPRSIVDPYLRVQAQLVGDETDRISTDAAAIVFEADKLGAPGKLLVTAARELETARDLKAAREAFGKLSDALIAYANATGAALADLKIAYCSMARKSWLQKGDRIRNPYYGQQMPDCGEFKKR